MAERRKAFRHRRQQQIGNPPRAVLLTDVQRRVVALQPFNFLPHVSDQSMNATSFRARP
jgi:hypothetical protein